MTKPIGSFLFLFSLFLLLNSGEYLNFAEGEVEQETWCIARYTSNDAQLNNNIFYACNDLKDCMMIQEGGSCFNPNNLLGHASAAMNQYYANNGRNPWNCDFSGTGLILITDPSYENCTFA
ncbi:PREDICTED: major pollen allergen Ole e 10-like [Lupinus angustifolius]|uniref:major pollen allergen Ole e 10-like n=1 Tax=Lupinus angustifolius TaxID=3871 RepID=UPI00092F4D3D|nr:PREDICTED: major pollen allergen Ole e 10-like [Lupinus angustifolius]